MTYRDEPIQTILAVGEPRALALEIAFSAIHYEAGLWELLPVDRHRFEVLGLSARTLSFHSPSREYLRRCLIYAHDPLPTGVLRALAEGTRADAAILFVPPAGSAPGAPLLRELRDGGVHRAVVLLDTGFPPAPGDALDRAEQSVRRDLSRAGFDGDATPILRGTTEGAMQLFEDKHRREMYRREHHSDDPLDLDGAAYDAYEAARVGWCDELLAALDALPVLRTSGTLGPVWFPGGISFACAVCGLSLTRTLHERPDRGEPSRDEDYVPEGCFAISRGAPHALAGQAIVNQEDVTHAHALETSTRDCCGHRPSSSGEHNLGCDNGHPVGFSWTAHWLPSFVAFDPERVVRREAPSSADEPGDQAIG